MSNWKDLYGRGKKLPYKRNSNLPHSPASPRRMEPEAKPYNRINELCSRLPMCRLHISNAPDCHFHVWVYESSLVKSQPGNTYQRGFNGDDLESLLTQVLDYLITEQGYELPRL